MRAIVLLLMLGVCAAVLPSCQAVAAAEANRRRHSTHLVKADFTGLEGKTIAVVVAADRFIQSDHPDLVDYVTTNLTKRLSQSAIRPNPSGYVPAKEVLTYLYDNPAWPSKPMTEIAKGLGGVERIVFVELSEFRLREPGNQYEWDGVASGTVAVVAVDSTTPDEYVYQKPITVRYPDGKGYGPEQVSMSAVMTELARRFVERTAWHFYDHEEPYEPKY
ncbi:MAG TPA: hypothetical protein VD997_04830 [Phycisphaerales bacterium]|nr:hypothetical protein [Phycisphaerales bacterium]